MKNSPWKLNAIAFQTFQPGDFSVECSFHAHVVQIQRHIAVDVFPFLFFFIFIGQSKRKALHDNRVVFTRQFEFSIFDDNAKRFERCLQSTCQAWRHLLPIQMTFGQFAIERQRGNADAM